MIDSIWRLLNSRGATWIILVAGLFSVLVACIAGVGNGWTLVHAGIAGFAIRELIGDKVAKGGAGRD